MDSRCDSRSRSCADHCTPTACSPPETAAADRSDGGFTHTCTLSQSPIWHAQRQFYESRAEFAFKVVPNYITSNAFIAQRFVDLILAFLADCARLPSTSTSDPDDGIRSGSGSRSGSGGGSGRSGCVLSPAEPVYVVEVGSGTGQLAYSILTALSRVHQDEWPRHPTDGSPIKICLVMTDFFGKALDYWERSGYFDAFLERGLVDFAIFDAERTRELVLKHSKVTITKGSLHNPLVCLATYVVDSLLQECFRVTQTGDLHEVLVELNSPKDLSNPTFLRDATIEWKLGEPLATRYVTSPAHTGTETQVTQQHRDENALSPQLGWEGRSFAGLPDHLRDQPLVERLLSHYHTEINRLGDAGGTTILPLGAFTLFRTVASWLAELSSDTSSRSSSKPSSPSTASSQSSQSSSLSCSSLLLHDVPEEIVKRPPLLWMVADKAYTSLGDLLCDSSEFAPAFVTHGDGCFSFNANLHAFGLFNAHFSPESGLFGLRRPSAGFSLHMGGERSIDVSAFVHSSHPRRSFAETLRTYSQQFKRLGPDVYFGVYDGMFRDDFYLGDNIEQILALLRLAEFDATMYYTLSDSVSACLDKHKLEDHQRAELIRSLLRVWRCYYHHPSNDDVPFEIAIALLSLDQPAAALPVFRFSLAHWGADWATLQNLLTCCELLGDWESALEYCDRCLAQRPRDQDMLERRAHILGVLRRAQQS